MLKLKLFCTVIMQYLYIVQKCFCISYPVSSLCCKQSRDIFIFSHCDSIFKILFSKSEFCLLLHQKCGPSLNWTYSLEFNYLSCNQHPSKPNIPHLISTNDALANKTKGTNAFTYKLNPKPGYGCTEILRYESIIQTNDCNNSSVTVKQCKWDIICLQHVFPTSLTDTSISLVYLFS